jgi:hypothetical protein
MLIVIVNKSLKLRCQVIANLQDTESLQYGFVKLHTYEGWIMLFNVDKSKVILIDS